MKGIIYKIVCNETNEVYYGSSKRSLNERMSDHKKDHKRWKAGKYHYVTSFQIIERGNYSYSLIETVECEDKKQLEAVERKYIENNECVNKYIVGRTKKEYNKAYREANKDKIKEEKKAYREANKDKIKEEKKAYREANKDKINEKQKEVYYLKQKQLKE
jgi:hypothetical protein